MRKYLLLLLLASASATAQMVEPVKWSTSVRQVSDSEFELMAEARIDEGYHLYSQSVPPDGPKPTLFTFEQVEGMVTFLGKTMESVGRTEFDSIFEMDITYFENLAKFTQRIEVGEKITTIRAVVEYMACDNSKCINVPEKELVFQIRDSPQSIENAIEPNLVDATNSEKAGAGTGLNRELWSVFLIAFLSGFAALLTPCVFPMIPLTVSFFTKQNGSRAMGIKNAMLYSVFIIVIYVVLGTAVTAIFGADALNALATNVWFNLLFFLLLISFALSFFGAFEILLPNSWVNKVDSRASKGGVLGIFFMALALALVSFSCTGPIVGTLLVESASQGGMAPLIGMLGFSMAIALPFALFATFPGWLNSLPKSGGWLNTVKVVLGFLELALAFKFLSQADLVLQAHLLEREVFIAIWIAIFGALTMYLFGKIQMPHDPKMGHLSVGRLGLGLLVLSFTIYLVPGLWGAPLNMISAFPPPLEYSESPYGVGNYRAEVSTDPIDEVDEMPEGAHLLPPYDLMVFDDYEKGLTYAREVGKPVLVDFTGWACVNCRKMEQKVWPKPEVLQILKNKVVLISLYVDDKRPLKKSEITESRLRPGKKIKYVGQKWSELQAMRYKTNSQPFYVLMDVQERNLVEPIGYTPDAEQYLAWLNAGIERFDG